MEKLKFKWTARFNNEDIIEQYPDIGGETLFKKVEDRMDDLVEFSMTDDDGKFVAVNLNSGTLNCNNEKLHNIDIADEKPELVYFRRNQVILNTGTGEQLRKNVEFHIGLKTSKEKKMVVWL